VACRELLFDRILCEIQLVEQEACELNRKSGPINSFNFFKELE
jgi:hypothetical protein